MAAAPVPVLPPAATAMSGDDADGREPAPAGPGGVCSPSGSGGAHPTGTAVFSPGSPDYRYLLTRRWAPGPVMTRVMLNPSRADDVSDDATIRRCVAFARAAGCSTITVTNLYAWRTRDPRELQQVVDPVGPDNDAWIRAAVEAGAGGPVVAAWGARAEPARVQAVLQLLAGCPPPASPAVPGHHRGRSTSAPALPAGARAAATSDLNACSGQGIGPAARVGAVDSRVGLGRGRGNRRAVLPRLRSRRAGRRRPRALHSESAPTRRQGLS